MVTVADDRMKAVAAKLIAVCGCLTVNTHCPKIICSKLNSVPIGPFRLPISMIYYRLNMTVHD